MNNLHAISVQDFENITIGQVENPAAGTGCTVLLGKNGMCAGVDIRGGGPAARDTDLALPLTNTQTIHAVVLAGGSAFGLEAATGVQEYLETQGIGYDTGAAIVPLVCQIDLYDLGVGNPTVRPDKKMGYAAAKAALEGGNYRDGCFGAGCGATVGKARGIHHAMKSGIGSYAVQLGDLKVGAVAAVNALGDIFDYQTGVKLAGLRNDNGCDFASSEEELYRIHTAEKNFFTANTTLGAVFTNARFDKTKLCKIAGMTHDGYARSIRPVHSSADGDAVFALSLGNIEANMDLVGMLAANVMSEAIAVAVKTADPAFGLPSYSSMPVALKNSNF